jgi:hypothetical protein
MPSLDEHLFTTYIRVTLYYVELFSEKHTLTECKSTTHTDFSHLCAFCCLTRTKSLTGLAICSPALDGSLKYDGNQQWPCGSAALSTCHVTLGRLRRSSVAIQVMVSPIYYPVVWYGVLCGYIELEFEGREVDMFPISRNKQLAPNSGQILRSLVFPADDVVPSSTETKLVMGRDSFVSIHFACSINIFTREGIQRIVATGSTLRQLFC